LVEKCIPVTADGHYLPSKWQDGDKLKETLDSLTDQPVRIYLELEQARLYAIRMDADLVYGFVPETNLAGEYIEGKCY
jgi:hypothetical protein